MNGVLVDSNVILDVFEADPAWVDWSEAMLEQYSIDHYSVRMKLITIWRRQHDTNTLCNV